MSSIYANSANHLHKIRLILIETLNQIQYYRKIFLIFYNKLINEKLEHRTN